MIEKILEFLEKNDFLLTHECLKSEYNSKKKLKSLTPENYYDKILEKQIIL